MLTGLLLHWAVRRGPLGVERYARVTDEEILRVVCVAYSHAEGDTKGATAARSEHADSGAMPSSKSWPWYELHGWRPQRDSNPCFSLERATS